MSVKIKIFKMVPENSGEITDFMDTVKVLQDGIIVSDGAIAIMYKGKEDVGMDTDSLITAISGELVKSQKQFVLQDGLTKAYEGMIKKYSADHKDAQDNADTIQAELNRHMAGYDEQYEGDVNRLTAELQSITDKHQKTNKKEKDIREALLKQHQEKAAELKAATEKFTAYKTEFDAKSNEISARMGEFAVKAANIMADIKENNGFLETAEKDREHARVFIGSTKKYIKDLEEGKIVVG